MSGYTEIEGDIEAQRPVAKTQVGAAAGASEGATGPGAGAESEGFVGSTLARLRQSAHPGALVFYIFFRTAPVFLYIFGGLLLRLFAEDNRFILHFILLILLVSADFWNLKNISGRLLVGLRWWNETKADGADFENVWVFETADPSRYINPIDSKVFWTLLYVQPAAWVVLGLMAVLKLEMIYLMFIIISISLSLTNAVAFTRCDKFGKANDMANNIFASATSSLFSRLNPFA